MKKCLFLLLLPLLGSCGVSDSRIDAYEESIPAVEKAGSREELLRITYDLSKQLHVLDMQNMPVAELERAAVAGNEDARERFESIEAARLRFLDVVAGKEKGFYVSEMKK